jgi:SAM-dependent methyltransferase
MNNARKLNLGCGKDIKNGYVNLDFVKIEGIDVVHNLNKTPYPFKDETFEEIYASSVLEHLDGDWFKIIGELYRILKKEGILIIKVPHFSNAVAFMENHRRFFRYRSFEDFSEQENLSGLDQKQGYKFKIIYRKIKFTKWPLIFNYLLELFVNQSRSASILYENTFLRSLFPARELIFKLQKR